MRRALLLLSLPLLACPPDFRPPGDENMGTFTFRAEPVSKVCELAIQSDSFAFSGTLTRNRDGGQAFLSLNQFARPATFDGQYFVSAHTAASALEECAPCTTQVTETIAVALLSKAQSEALGDRCPPAPLDGGVPSTDGGPAGPGPTEKGFDAVRACGEMTDVITATPPTTGEACPAKCSGCTFNYRLTAERL